MAKDNVSQARHRTNGVYFVMSPEETEIFEKRMEQTGIRNRSAFIRKMCIDGHVLIYDSERIDEIGRLTRITSNNINQIARKVNSGGIPHRNDIAEIISNQTEIRRQYGELLGLLSEVASDKPGKRFMQPLRFSDISGEYGNQPTAEGGQ